MQMHTNTIQNHKIQIRIIHITRPSPVYTVYVYSILGRHKPQVSPHGRRARVPYVGCDYLVPRTFGLSGFWGAPSYISTFARAGGTGKRPSLAES
eukprot:scaffold7657_cov109-Isochrysis_galbana.AAC.5